MQGPSRRNADSYPLIVLLFECVLDFGPSDVKRVCSTRRELAGAKRKALTGAVKAHVIAIS